MRFAITPALKRTAIAAAAVCAVVAPLMVPGTAHAWWYRGGWGWRPGFVVAVPPVVVAPQVVYAPPRPVVVAPRRYAHWVRPHYDWRGYYIPGHWA